jgi:hypothetical protein
MVAPLIVVVDQDQSVCEIEPLAKLSAGRAIRFARSRISGTADRPEDRTPSH